MSTPFENLSKRVKKIKIGNDEVLVKPKASDIEVFVSMGEKFNEDDAKKLTNCFVNMIHRAYVMENQTINREDIEDYVAENYSEVMYAVMELFGFATKDKIDSLKKNVIGKTGVKTL